MKKDCIFINKSIDRNGLEKTLVLTELKPKIDTETEEVTAGRIVFTSKGDKAGVILDTGEIADLIFALTKIRKEQLETEYKLNQELVGTIETRKMWK